MPRKIQDTASDQELVKAFEGADVRNVHAVEACAAIAGWMKSVYGLVSVRSLSIVW